MSHPKYYIFIACILLGAVSCIPLQKFQETDKKYNNCNNELELNKQKQEQLTVDNTEMKQHMTKLESQVNSLIKDSIANADSFEKLGNEFDKVNKQYTELQETQETILKGNAHETAKLMKQLQTAQEELKKREERLKTTETALDEKKTGLDNLKAELEKRNARLVELEKILFKKDSNRNCFKNESFSCIIGF